KRNTAVTCVSRLKTNCLHLSRSSFPSCTWERKRTCLRSSASSDFRLLTSVFRPRFLLPPFSFLLSPSCFLLPTLQRLHWITGAMFLDLEPEKIVDCAERLRIGRSDLHPPARFHFLILIDDARLHPAHHVCPRRPLVV